MIQPIFITTEFGLRVAARYGLDFYIESFHGVPELTERGEYGTESRDPTGPELQMWSMLVPQEERELLDGLMLRTEPPVLKATPPELYTALIYKKAVYLSPQDLAVARRLRAFEPENDRERLLEGRFGVFDGETAVFVSREIPQGFFYPTEERVPELHWEPPAGERQVRPPLDPQVEAAIQCELRMLRVDSYVLPAELAT